MRHFSCSKRNLRSNEQLARRINLQVVDLACDRPLVSNRELTNILQLITKELQTKGMLTGGWKDIQDAAANRKLSALDHHVNAQITDFY